MTGSSHPQQSIRYGPPWVTVDGRTTNDGREPHGAQLRFHDEWWHTVFHTATGFQVVLGPIGIDLGRFATPEKAREVAESNARERALNELTGARRAIGRSELVLAAMTGKQQSS